MFIMYTVYLLLYICITHLVIIVCSNKNEKNKHVCCFNDLDPIMFFKKSFFLSVYYTYIH